LIGRTAWRQGAPEWVLSFASLPFGRTGPLPPELAVGERGMGELAVGPSRGLAVVIPDLVGPHSEPVMETGEEPSETPPALLAAHDGRL
jgi:hypothetical protein